MFAQQKGVAGKIEGTVFDQNGAAVGDAEVRLLNSQQVLLSTTKTNAEGRFVFENLTPGSFVVRAARADFSPASEAVQILANGAAVTVNFALQINELDEKVTVTAETGVAENRRNVPQQINVVSQDALRQRATSVLAQAGAEEVGLNVQRTSPTVGAIVVRGLTGKNVVVYTDGVRYTNSAQRGGINTFFNLNEPTALQSIEVLRGASSAQYGSDALGGTVNLITKNPYLGEVEPEFHGEFNTNFNSADRSFGGSTLFSYGTNKLGGYVNLAARRINNLRTADERDSHSAITRFLGLPSSVLYERNPDTAFTQYGGTFRLNFSPADDQQIVFHYQRSQQDGGKRFDQLVGGDGNLVADLRNLMLDFGYLRYVKQNFVGFDSVSATISYNSQREERVNQGGQGNPFGDITHQYERTSATGFSFFLDKSLPARNMFTVGGDFYHEKINSPAYTFSPQSGSTTVSRPRVPDEARFDSGGLFAQNVWQAIPEKLRFSGALRYSAAQYKARAADAPVVAGRRLWQDDGLRVGNLSGRFGAVWQIFKDFRMAANYSRGFRYPSMTDLGTLGLTGDGFEVDHLTAQALGGTVGTTANANTAVSTNLPVEKQRPEFSNNFDLSFRYQKRRFDTELTGFVLDIEDTITKQALILPPGAVGRFLGDQPITGQRANGTVFVPLSTAPVLVRSNYTSARIYGLEYELETHLTSEYRFTGNFTYIRATDKDTGLPPNIEGGTPPATAFLSFRYDPTGKPFWLELYSTLAARQNRLSSLDLSDRRTGAARSRAQIQNFFRRGACARGLTTPGANNQCNTAGGILLATGETLAQVQNRLLPLGATINGVRVVDNDTAVPLYTYLPSYGLVNLRGGFRFGENSQIFVAFENIFDRFHRNPSWGIDGAGRSLRVAYRFRF